MDAADLDVIDGKLRHLAIANEVAVEAALAQAKEQQ
jgi:hypothetical protein